MIRKVIASCALPLLVSSTAFSGLIVLVNPETGLRNGGFEGDLAAETFTAAPFWDSYFPEGASAVAVVGTDPRSGARHALISGYQGSGNRLQPSQTISSAEWMIAEGDVFTIQFYGKAATGFDAGTDKAQVILHVVNGSGALVWDNTSGEAGSGDRLVSRDISIPTAGQWHAGTVTSNPVRAGSPWIGQRLMVRLLHTGDRNEFLAIDDVKVTAGRDAGSYPGVLASAYAFDGDLVDDSGGNHDGSSTEGTSFGRGFGEGASLEGGDGVAAFIPHVEPGDFSIAGWIQTSVPGHSGTGMLWSEASAIVDGGGVAGGFGMGVRESLMVFGVNGRTLFSRTAVNDGSWHHVAVTRNSVTGALQLYVDGELEATGSGGTGDSGGGEDLSLCAARDGSRAFDGLLDDLQIYTGILTSEEIKAIRLGSGDSDKDGRSNVEEEIAGTCWGDANDFLKPGFVRAGSEAGGFRVDLDGRADRFYRLWRIDDGQVDGPMEEVATSPVMEEDAPVAVTDPTPPSGRSFYRVEAAKGTPERPNIIFIVADDHGYADLGAYAHAMPDIKQHTPNLDRLAAGGTLFTQAYATGPVCSPARTSMMTGRYPHEWDSSGGWTPGLPLKVPTIAEYLLGSGYSTSMLGKNDHGKGFFVTNTREHPLNHGFQSFFGFSAHAHDFYLHSEDIRNRAIGTTDSAHLGPLISNNGREALPDGKWLPEELTDRAITYFNGQTNATKPFFLNLCYNSVHSLIHQVPDSYLAAEGLPTLPDYDPTGAFSNYGNYYYSHSRPGNSISNADMRKYYRAHLRAFDDQIGRLLDGLEESGLASNTLIVYISDNGGEAFTGANNSPLSGCKYTTFEGGIRVPMIMSWPGRIPAGATYSHVVSSLDIVPTFIDAARVTDTPNLRGRSLLKPLQNDTPVMDEERTLFWQFNSFWAIRHGDWKLMYSNKGDANGHTSQIRFNSAALGTTALFNLATDPGENTNLASDPAYAAKRAELQALYNAWRASL